MPDPFLQVIAGPNGRQDDLLRQDPGTGERPPLRDCRRHPSRPLARCWPEHPLRGGRARGRGTDPTDPGPSVVRHETVFSHGSKVALLNDAKRAGYRVTLHTLLIPQDLAVAQVINRVTHEGPAVREDKAPGSSACGGICETPSSWSTKRACTTTPRRPNSSGWSRRTSMATSPAAEVITNGCLSSVDGPDITAWLEFHRRLQRLSS